VVSDGGDGVVVMVVCSVGSGVIGEETVQRDFQFLVSKAYFSSLTFKKTKVQPPNTIIKYTTTTKRHQNRNRLTGVSRRLIRLLSLSALFDIFDVPSNRDITLAPS